MTKQVIGVVLFDVGDTLIYDSPSFLETCAEVIRTKNIEPHMPSMRLYVTRTEASLQREKQKPNLYSNDESIRNLWKWYFGGLIKAGAPALSDEAEQLGLDVYDVYNPGEKWAVFPDVPQALKALYDRRFQLHVLSDWGSFLPEILRSVELDHFFSDFHISTHIGHAKESSDIYLLALRKSSLQPAEALMIGDSCERDVHVPQSIGITSFFVDRIGQRRCEAVKTFSNLTDLVEYIISNYRPK